MLSYSPRLISAVKHLLSQCPTHSKELTSNKPFTGWRRQVFSIHESSKNLQKIFKESSNSNCPKLTETYENEIFLQNNPATNTTKGN